MKKKCRYNSSSFTVNWMFRIIFGACLVMLSNCGEGGGNKEPSDTASTVIYYCPMHPEVEQDHPGNCAKCNGMVLIPKPVGTTIDAVLRPVSSSVISAVKVTTPVFVVQPIFTLATGYLDYDNYSTSNVSALYSGRIEKLYVKYNYQLVRKGQLLFEIYNPDLVTAQENLLFVLKNSPDDSALIEASRQKLLTLQLSRDQVRQIETSGKVMHAIPVYSSYDGHIHEMSSGQMLQGMSSTGYQNTPLLSTKEGMYVEQGQIVFSVANPQKIVAMLRIKTADIGKVKVGQTVSYYVNNDSTVEMTGNVDFIEPAFDNSKTLMVRVNLNPDHNHKVGSLVNAKIKSDSLQALWVPESAVVSLGKNKIVWLKQDGYFIARKVETGAQSGDMIEISDGLTDADEIALEGHYLADSEDFIKINSNE